MPGKSFSSPFGTLASIITVRSAGSTRLAIAVISPRNRSSGKATDVASTGAPMRISPR